MIEIITLKKKNKKNEENRLKRVGSSIFQNNLCNSNNNIDRNKNKNSKGKKYLENINLNSNKSIIKEENEL